MMPTAMPRSFSPHTHNSLSLRTQQDPYRSLPGTPMGLGPRAMSSMDFGPSAEHVRSMIQPNGPDYFSNPAARYNPSMRPRSPFPGMGEYDQDGGYPGAPYGAPDMSPDSMVHFISRTNMAATLINTQVDGRSKQGKIFPHVCEDGRFPKEFEHAKTVETMRVLDNSQLDRIMQAYRLPLDLTSMERAIRAGSVHSSTKIRKVKLLSLLEYLGANKVIEYERMRNGLI